MVWIAELPATVGLSSTLPVYSYCTQCLGLPKDLVAHVITCPAMPAVRVSTTVGMDRIVHRAGLAWGGPWFFVNVGDQQSLIEQGCEFFIAGETDNHRSRFPKEVGIPVIETSRELSKNPGLRRSTGMLQTAFPEVSFSFYGYPCVWRTG